jgi:hypothetical protein
MSASVRERFEAQRVDLRDFKQERDEAKIAQVKRELLDLLVSWNEYFKGRTFAVRRLSRRSRTSRRTGYAALKAFSELEIPPDLAHLRAWHDRIAAQPSVCRGPARRPEWTARPASL